MIGSDSRVDASRDSIDAPRIVLYRIIASMIINGGSDDDDDDCAYNLKVDTPDNSRSEG